MGRRATSLFFRIARMTMGALLIGWGVISFIIFILPGGLWTILLGLAILAIDIPWLKRAEERLMAALERRFPKFYRRVIIPVDRIKERLFEKVRSFFGSNGGD